MRNNTFLLGLLVFFTGNLFAELPKCGKVWECAAKCDFKGVEYYATRSKYNLNETDGNGYTALHRAALKNCTDVVKMLIEYEDVNMNARTKGGETPLMLAASFLARNSCNNLDLIKLLVDKNEQGIELRSTSGNTALCEFAESGCDESIKFMVAKGANINVRCARGDTTLHCAIKMHKTSTALLLADLGADPEIISYDGIRKNAIEYAEDEGNTMVAEYLKEKLRRKKEGM